MKSSKAELEQILKALAGTGPVGLAQLERISGRDRRSFERWAKADSEFSALLAPQLLRRRESLAPKMAAKERTVVTLDPALVEKNAVLEERVLQLCETIRGIQSDLATVLAEGKKKDALIELQRARIAELEAGYQTARTPSHLRLVSDEKTSV